MAINPWQGIRVIDTPSEPSVDENGVYSSGHYVTALGREVRSGNSDIRHSTDYQHTDYPSRRLGIRPSQGRVRVTLERNVLSRDSIFTISSDIAIQDDLMHGSITERQALETLERMTTHMNDAFLSYLSTGETTYSPNLEEIMSQYRSEGDVRKKGNNKKPTKRTRKVEL